MKRSGRYTVKQVLVGWLTSVLASENHRFKSHNIETDVVRYGESLGVKHSPGTYSRAFRDLKARGSFAGMEVRLVSEKGNEHEWIVERS